MVYSPRRDFFPMGKVFPAFMEGTTMSQHYCRTSMNNKPVEVLMGWDRPLQGFFMVIFDLSSPKAMEDMIYSNLNERNPYPKVLDPFANKLEEMGIQVPKTMLEEVEEDKSFDAGNKLRRHELTSG